MVGQTRGPSTIYLPEGLKAGRMTWQVADATLFGYRPDPAPMSASPVLEAQLEAS